MKRNGIGATAKVAILLVLFGIPILFVAMSYGLSILFDIAPGAILLLFTFFYGAYSGSVGSALYDFYEVKKPLWTYVPYVGDLWLIDSAYRTPCLILYIIAAIFVGLALLPYEVLKVFGTSLALTINFYFMIIAIAILAVVQIIKGIGLRNCMRDIKEEWESIFHSSVGALSTFTVCGFLPFVRIITLYALNKPLSTLKFQHYTASSVEDDVDFVSEEEDEEISTNR